MNRIAHAEFNFNLPASGGDSLSSIELARWTQTVLVPAIDKAIDDLKLSNEHIIIDNIDLYLEGDTLKDIESSFCLSVYRKLKEYVDSRRVKASTESNVVCISPFKNEKSPHIKPAEPTSSPDTKEHQTRFIQLLSALLGVANASGIRGSVDGRVLAALQTAWPALIKSIPSWIMDILQTYLRNQVHRRTMANFLPDYIQNNFILALEPIDGRSILTFINRISHLGSLPLQTTLVGNDESPLETKPANQKSRHLSEEAISTIKPYSKCWLRRYLVEFSLAYLTCERGNQFNKKMYLRSMMRQMAAHDNIDVEVMATNLHTALIQSKLDQTLSSELAEILDMCQQNRTPTVESKQEPTLITHQNNSDNSGQSPLECNTGFDFTLHNANILVARLLTGRAGHGSNSDEVAGAIRLLLNASPNRILTALRKSEFSRSACNTIALYLPEDLRTDLAKLISPQALQATLNYIAPIKTVFMETDLYSSSMFDVIFWGYYFHFLAHQSKKKSSNATLQEFLDGFISISVDKSNREEKEIGEMLLANWESASDENIYCCDVRQVISRRVFDAKPQLDTGATEAVVFTSKNGRQRPGAVGRQQYIQKLKVKYIEALNICRWTLKPQQWHLLRQNDSSQLSSLTHYLLQQQRLRQGVALNFPHLIQTDMVALLDHRAVNHLAVFWAHRDGISDILRPHNKLNKFDNNIQIESALREFTFSYLVLDRGSEFNRQSYARNLLRNLANRYNISYGRLLYNLQSLIDDNALNPALKAQFKGVVSDPVQPEQSTHDVEFADGEKGAQCYALLVSLVSGSVTAQELKWNTLLRRLMTHHRDYLHRLVRDLQTGYLAYSSLLQHAPFGTLIVLFETVLMANSGRGGTPGSVMVKTISDAAKRSSHPKAYLLAAIQTLLQGEVIDLTKLEPSIDKIITTDTVSLVVEPLSPLPPHPPSSKSSNSQPIGKQRTISENVVHIHPSLSKQQIYRKIYQMHIAELRADNDVTLSEVDNILLFKQFDEIKFNRLFPVAQIIRHSVMSLPYAGVGTALATAIRRLRPKHYELLFCKSMSDQFMHLNRLVNSDRFVQVYLTNLVILLKWSFDHYSFAELIKSLAAVVQRNTGLTSLAIVNSIRDTIMSLSAADIGISTGRNPAAKHTPVNLSVLQPTQLQSVTKKSQRKSQHLQSEMAIKKYEDQISSTLEHGLVHNAGVVILSSYIPMLFERLGLLKNKCIDGMENKHRAIQILHYLTYGEQLDFIGEQQDHLLSKILCGVGIGEILELTTTLSNSETECADSLLDAVISHWNILGSTSRSGLRETFFQRTGTLNFTEKNGWHLKVEKRPFDVLIDRLPWSFGTLKYAFMTDILQVEWR